MQKESSMLRQLDEMARKMEELQQSNKLLQDNMSQSTPVRLPSQFPSPTQKLNLRLSNKHFSPDDLISESVEKLQFSQSPKSLSPKYQGSSVTIDEINSLYRQKSLECDELLAVYRLKEQEAEELRYAYALVQSHVSGFQEEM